MEIAQFCKEFSDRGVVAIDIAGTGHEGGIPIDAHQKAFQVRLIVVVNMRIFIA